MAGSGLSQQVQAFHAWKQDIIREIMRYQSWLRKNDLYSDDLHAKLQRSIALLREDELTIAFVGEFSRGKTELINALFFADYGQRMLPSQAGRTTMCPTELFYDRQQDSTYLKLLPIETRAHDRSLSHYRNVAEHWVHYPLDDSSPEAMRQSLAHVARTRSVTEDEARKYGFQLDTLERDPNQPGHYIIPAWRHALISLDHPLLQQGIRILDTPGLNALGSEPELTLSMIPHAHAVVFLLGADTGVTASDMRMWKDFIANDQSAHQAGRFAVLNKIDILWDDIQGDAFTESSIEAVRTKTADQLGLLPKDILTLSAKQALHARIRGDEALLRRSNLQALEALLSERILAQKERLITQTMINDMLGMLQTSQAILQSREQSLQERLDTYRERGISPSFLKELTEKTQEDYNYYYKKLFTLRSSRRLMRSQAQILDKIIHEERFESHARHTYEELKNSWTTVGMSRAIAGFFTAIEHDMANLQHEARLAEKMVHSIYQRYASDDRTPQLQPSPFNIRRSLDELQQLKQRADQFRSSIKTILTEQTLVVKRFFNTLVAEARRIYVQIRKETQRWPQEALLPIIQHTLEQKQMLELQIRRLKELAGTARDTRSQMQRIEMMVADIRAQIEEADTIQRRLRRPPPQTAGQKVVSLPGAGGPA
ncbi:dynamin family protein [Hahella sp. SMD15-11]|uniref:Dynamin family protein n=1 Tax=Thermohahella caldifontis TaxID=3142973 RepID=A0AB39UV23_9GAMM